MRQPKPETKDTEREKTDRGTRVDRRGSAIANMLGGVVYRPTSVFPCFHRQRLFESEYVRVRVRFYGCETLYTDTKGTCPMHCLHPSLTHSLPPSITRHRYH